MKKKHKTCREIFIAEGREHGHQASLPPRHLAESCAGLPVSYAEDPVFRVHKYAPLSYIKKPIFTTYFAGSCGPP